ncbi:glucosaminidase domain-containing protein [Flavobacterium sp. RHBU_24]|uniref:glucosaminidase domain-containing protein n=1 Tax=Flavobacterium sp. RHBU_24 TaxID=3391185 RepID=UPI0039851535
MIKKIAAFIVLISLAACGTSKPHIQTTKADNDRKKAQREKAYAAHSRKPKTTTKAKTTKEKESVTLVATSKTTVYSEQVKQYVDNYKGIAQTNMKKHGIPASIILAQGILESGAGYGDLAVNANNHFGIKCHNDWTGDKVYHDDDTAQECFRKYPTAAGSFEDHAVFLTGRSRYAELFKLDKDDYESWAKGLRAAGYATDPKYPEKLIGLIERFELAQYDQEVLGGKVKPKPVIVKDQPALVEAEKLPAQVKTPKVVAPGTTVTVTTPAEKAPATITPAATIQQAGSPQPPDTIVAQSYTVAQGDTLYSISKKHNTTVDELIRLNSLEGNAISIGQVLKVR